MACENNQKITLPFALRPSAFTILTLIPTYKSTIISVGLGVSRSYDLGEIVYEIIYNLKILFINIIFMNILFIDIRYTFKI